MSLGERFWSKVDVQGPEDDWEWTAARDSNGYGNIKIDGKARKANRVVWEITYGDIPEGLGVLHTCDNRACVNPSHLYVGDQRQNTLDRLQRGRDGMSPFDPTTVREVRHRAQRGEYQKDIAADYGVTQSTISNIVNRRTWDHVE